MNLGYTEEHNTRIYFNSNNKEGALFLYRLELLYGAAEIEGLAPNPEIDTIENKGQNLDCMKEFPPEFCADYLPGDDGIFKRYIGLGFVKRIVRNWTISGNLPSYLRSVSIHEDR